MSANPCCPDDAESLSRDATVTVCHSRSKDLVKECQEADIIIAALGQPNFVKAEMVKEGAVVIDVGTTRVPDTPRNPVQVDR